MVSEEGLQSLPVCRLSPCHFGSSGLCGIFKIVDILIINILKICTDAAEPF